jgi:metal-responsive CopG/Arc/MetJ family transcriptional regulator
MGQSVKATGQQAVVSARLPADLLKKIEAFAAQRNFNRSEAIGRLIALGINANPPYEAHLAVLPQHAFA